MNRKLVYGICAAVLGLGILSILMMPKATRATFFSEFQHRTKLMFGVEPAPIAGADGSQGLRIEHPEEYGPGAHGESGEEAAEEPEEKSEDTRADGSTDG